MSKPRKQHGVVVGVDGSLESDAAACWGATDAAMRNIPLTVVHVVNADVATWPPMPYPETWGFGRRTRVARSSPTPSSSPKRRLERIESSA